MVDIGETVWNQSIYHTIKHNPYSLTSWNNSSTKDPSFRLCMVLDRIHLPGCLNHYMKNANICHISPFSLQHHTQSCSLSNQKCSEPINSRHEWSTDWYTKPTTLSPFAMIGLLFTYWLPCPIHAPWKCPKFWNKRLDKVLFNNATQINDQHWFSMIMPHVKYIRSSNTSLIAPWHITCIQLPLPHDHTWCFK